MNQPHPVGPMEDLAIDHEVYAGEVMPDPWVDEAQEDWSNKGPMLDADEFADDDREEPEEDPA